MENELSTNSIKTDSAISCEVFTSFELLEGIQKEWDSFVESVKGDIYLTYDWCRIWWEHYGAGRSLHVFVFRIGANLVGLVPFFIERIWLGPIWLRIAKITGADFTICMVNPPVRPEYAEEIFGQIIEYLTCNLNCDAIWFGPVSGVHESIDEFRKACKTLSRSATIIRDTVLSPYTTFTLPNTFKEYLQSLGKLQRSNYKRNINLLHKSFKVNVDVISDELQATAEFGKFIQMHAQQWQAEGKLGHFRDWPLGEEFNTAVAHAQAQRGRLRLVRLFTDNRVASYYLAYMFGDCYYWRLPARLVGPEWDHYALGRIGLTKMIEVAISEHVRRIEAGAGHYDYKIKLGGVERQLYSILVVKNRLTTRLRACLFCKAADLLHLLYYRIWFGRLAHKLPFRRRPLWKIWIRSHL